MRVSGAQSASRRSVGVIIVFVLDYFVLVFVTVNENHTGLLQTEQRGLTGLYVCLSVCLLITFINPAITAEPIKLPIGG